MQQQTRNTIRYYPGGEEASFSRRKLYPRIYEATVVQILSCFSLHRKSCSDTTAKKVDKIAVLKRLPAASLDTYRDETEEGIPVRNQWTIP